MGAVWPPVGENGAVTGNTGLVAHGVSNILRHIKAGDGKSELLIEFASALIMIGHA